MWRPFLSKRPMTHHQRSLHASVQRWTRDPKKADEAHETAKKYVGKIRQEEESKEPHPSPISPQAHEKLAEMERKTAEHDKRKQKK